MMMGCTGVCMLHRGWCFRRYWGGGIVLVNLVEYQLKYLTKTYVYGSLAAACASKTKGLQRYILTKIQGIKETSQQQEQLIYNFAFFSKLNKFIPSSFVTHPRLPTGSSLPISCESVSSSAWFARKRSPLGSLPTTWPVPGVPSRLKSTVYVYIVR
jgi:hypothetical protein